MRLIAVILPYAVSIRDFVHTGVLAELLRIRDLRIQIYTQNRDLPEFDGIRSDRVSVADMTSTDSGRLESLLKKIYPLMFRDTFVYVQQTVARSWKKRLLASILVAFRKVVGTKRALALFAQLLMRVSRRPNGGNQIFGEPDLVIGTRSTINSLDYPLLLEAARRGLPQLTAASSWDNFTTKGFFPFPVIKTIVWNRKMADELEQIFDIEPGDISIAGYPRLKLLQNSGSVKDAADYLARIGLNQYRRFVLYSASYAELTRTGMDEAPREYQLVREVATELADTLPADTCILVRLHPFSMAEDEAFFDGVPHLHVFVPGRRDRYVERVMSEEDETHLSAQLKFSECIVSMASTMTIDALSLGRPIINVAFDPGCGADDMIRRFYDFNHFRDLLEIVKPPVATRVQDVVDFVGRCMDGDQDPAIDQAAFARFYVPRDSLDYSRKVRETVEELLNNGK